MRSSLNSINNSPSPTKNLKLDLIKEHTGLEMIVDADQDSSDHSHKEKKIIKPKLLKKK